MQSEYEMICNICGGKSFQDFHSRKNCLCEGCRSLERTRTFAKLYEQEFKECFAPDRKILHISPSNTEKNFMRKNGISTVTIDIRPAVKVDIVADICNMPSVESDSFHTVLASGVLNAVYDDNLALSEIRRVMCDGGSLFLWVERSEGDKTRELDSDEIVNWYGKDAYEKYKVGIFRHYGNKDFLEQLKQYFSEARYFDVVDDVTGSTERWYQCVK